MADSQTEKYPSSQLVNRHQRPHRSKLWRATAQQFVDGFFGGLVRENSLGAGSTDNPEPCLASSERRKLESSRLESSKALAVEYSAAIPRLMRRVSQREAEINQEGSIARLLGQRYGKIGGEGGDSAAAFGAQKDE
jgi:hypothetical protein